MIGRNFDAVSPWANADRPERPEGLWGWGVRGLELALACICVATAVVLKLTLDVHGPMWIEGAARGAVLGVGGWDGFASRVWRTGEPPLYALFMQLWTTGFGASAASVRAPGLLAALATPFVVALVRTPGLSGSERLAWAALLGLWAPGVWFAHETRGYAALVLVSTLQTIAFVRLIRRPSRGRACVWATAVVVETLTHYHAGLLGVAQGLALIAVYGRGLAGLWPAALVFSPLAVWTGTHLPAMIASDRPDAAACSPGMAHRLEEALEAFVGGWPLLAGMGAVVVGGAVIERALRRRGATFSPGEGAVWLATLSALGGGGAVLALGSTPAGLTPRHLAVFAPGALLGLVLAARNLSDNGARTARTALLAMALGGAWNLSRFDRAPEGRGCPSRASAWVARAPPAR